VVYFIIIKAGFCSWSLWTERSLLTSSDEYYGRNIIIQDFVNIIFWLKACKLVKTSLINFEEGIFENQKHWKGDQ